MKQIFDTDSIIFKVLNGAADVKNAISGGIYAGDRPDNSVLEDITINTIDLTQDSFPQIGTSNVNIHVPDKSVLIDKISQKKADRERLTSITSLVLNALRTAKIHGLKYVVASQYIVRDLERSEHYVNLRIEWNIQK